MWFIHPGFQESVDLGPITESKSGKKEIGQKCISVLIQLRKDTGVPIHLRPRIPPTKFETS